MARPSGKRIALVGALAVTLAFGLTIAGSAALRDKIAAAYRGFADPSRVRPSFERGSIPGPPASIAELEQPDVGLDFEAAAASEIGDAGSLEELTLPDFPVPLSHRTVQFVGYFSSREDGRKAFVERLRRSGRYRDRIEQSLRDLGLPDDLVWLVAIESAFNPQAVSPKGATGLFQFMPETAEKYGLAMTDEIDERRSLVRAPAAGAQHLRDLFDHYGRWDLALAAYNLGKDPLDEAIERLRARRGEKNVGKPVEFKDLAEGHFIPKETANFVPQVQAFAIVAANRGRFGLDDLEVEKPLEFGELAVPAETPLRVIAKACGVSIGVVRDLNPDLLRDHAPSYGESLVLVPSDRIERAVAAFPALLAREAPQASAAPIASVRATVLSATAAPVALPVLPPPTPSDTPATDRFVLDNGVVVERREIASTSVSISSRVELFEPSRGGLRATGRAYDVGAVSAPERDVAGAMTRAAQAASRLVQGGGDASVDLRRRIFEPSRKAYERLPYGPAWLALGDALFPDKHPLSGEVVVAPLLPLASVLVGEVPRGALRLTVRVEGSLPRARVEAAARSSFEGVFGTHEIAPHPRDERVSASTSSASSPRIFVGWMAPREGSIEEPALRLALVFLANNQTGKVARAVVDHQVASHLRGTLDLGESASVLALEIEPAVPHDASDVLHELDRVLESVAREGPTAQELADAKERLRVYLKQEIPTAARLGESRESAEARLSHIRELADAVTAEQVREIVKRSLSPGHRVVVTGSPRR